MTLRRVLLIAGLMGCVAALLGQAATPKAQDRATVAPSSAPAGSVARFEFVDVFVDSGSEPLAAWQLEFAGTIASGSVELVGVEGGAPAAYAKPAYYDPDALSQNRVILAAFSTSKDLPTGRARVARLHLQLTGPADAAPSFTVSLTAAANPDGAPVNATASVSRGDKK